MIIVFRLIVFCCSNWVNVCFLRQRCTYWNLAGHSYRAGELQSEWSGRCWCRAQCSRGRTSRTHSPSPPSPHRQQVLHRPCSVFRYITIHIIWSHHFCGLHIRNYSSCIFIQLCLGLSGSACVLLFAWKIFLFFGNFLRDFSILIDCNILGECHFSQDSDGLRSFCQDTPLAPFHLDLVHLDSAGDRWRSPHWRAGKGSHAPCNPRHCQGHSLSSKGMFSYFWGKSLRGQKFNPTWVVRRPSLCFGSPATRNPAAARFLSKVVVLHF